MVQLFPVSVYSCLLRVTGVPVLVLEKLYCPPERISPEMPAERPHNWSIESNTYCVWVNFCIINENFLFVLVACCILLDVNLSFDKNLYTKLVYLL